jgi:hypothetical protein
VEDEVVEFGEWEKEDEGEEVDGEIYYGCREGYDWNDAYDSDEGSGGEGVGSSGMASSWLA